ncbi:hypothetical protein [Rhizobium leguminosarum]|uniref:hypothetical protein n=1 Tax=Rhizobium leguminosarum TaxID=384 RepID=UPI001F38E565|nr:hypothetical protein [Rhizobium leguminosarum]UIJ81785.1 hypothetical protein LZK78_11095 [Rhizobium leguminosarum]
MSKITTGLDARPKDSTIAQSGGLADDSGTPIEVTDEDAEKLRQKLEDLTHEKVKTEIDEFFEKPHDGSER